MGFKVNSTGCCGMLELVDISYINDSEKILVAAGLVVLDLDPSTFRPSINYKGKNRPFVIFTEVVERMRMDHVYHRVVSGGGYPRCEYVQDVLYGERLANYIHEHGLGNCQPSEVRKNYGGNPIRIWIWSVNHEAYEKWYYERQPEQKTGPDEEWVEERIENMLRANWR